MYCKHCGKNIYDLEKCPFCNDGENLKSDKEVEIHEGQNDNQQEPNISNSNSTSNSNQDSFYKELKKSNAGFNIIESISNIYIFAFIALLVFFLVKTVVGLSDSTALTVLDNMKYFCYCTLFSFGGLIIEFGSSYIFVRESQRRKIENKRFFEQKYELGKFDVETATAFDRTSLITLFYRYDKNGMYLSITKECIKRLLSVVMVIFMVPIIDKVSYLYALHKMTGYFDSVQLQAMLTSGQAFVFYVLVVVIFVSVFVLSKAIDTKKEALIERYKNNTLK